jgi:hypothetical protein
MITSLIVANKMSAGELVGLLVALALNLWAAFLFFKGSVTGAPPLYSKGVVQRILHFIAGIIFAAVALNALLRLVGK